MSAAPRMQLCGELQDQCNRARRCCNEAKRCIALRYERARKPRQRVTLVQQTTIEHQYRLTPGMRSIRRNKLGSRSDARDPCGQAIIVRRDHSV